MFTHIRQDYAQGPLNESDLDPNPFRQFDAWFQQALEADAPEPNAMTLATATRDGLPSARMVLLKEVDERGFVFYTNYDSQKGQELTANPRAALVFYWAALSRQVRVVGDVARVTHEESLAYFQHRPVGARVGALASRQSRPVRRDLLEQRVAELTAQYASGEVPLPDDWGGYRLTPHTIEFWQGRPSRLHDRLRYTRQPDGAWGIERLAP